MYFHRPIQKYEVCQRRSLDLLAAHHWCTVCLCITTSAIAYNIAVLYYKHVSNGAFKKISLWIFSWIPTMISALLFSLHDSRKNERVSNCESINHICLISMVLRWLNDWAAFCLMLKARTLLIIYDVKHQWTLRHYASWVYIFKMQEFWQAKNLTNNS